MKIVFTANYVNSFEKSFNGKSSNYVHIIDDNSTVVTLKDSSKICNGLTPFSVYLFYCEMFVFNDKTYFKLIKVDKA